MGLSAPSSTNTVLHLAGPPIMALRQLCALQQQQPISATILHMNAVVYIYNFNPPP